MHPDWREYYGWSDSLYLFCVEDKLTQGNELRQKLNRWTEARHSRACVLSCQRNNFISHKESTMQISSQKTSYVTGSHCALHEPAPEPSHRSCL